MCILYYELSTCIINRKPTSKLRNHVTNDPDSTDGALNSGNSDKMSQSTVLHSHVFICQGRLGDNWTPWAEPWALCVQKLSVCWHLPISQPVLLVNITCCRLNVCVERWEEGCTLRKEGCVWWCVCVCVGVWKNKQACLCEFGYFFVRMHQAGGATGKRKLRLKSTVDFHSVGNACEIKSFSFNILYFESPKRPCSINIFSIKLSAIFFNTVSYFL